MENDLEEGIDGATGVTEVSVDDDSPPLDGADGVNGPTLVSGEDLGIKRRVGRPLEENVSSKPRGVPRFPTPPARKFASESAAGKNRPNQAFNWLNGLPLAFRNRCDFYVYRDFPVLVTPPMDSDTNRPKWYKYIDIVSAADPNPIRSEEDLLNRYGCGRYRLILNETDKAKGEESRNIFMVTITGLGSDFDRHPPIDQLIGDINKVDLDHPDNRSYVQYLKRSGKLPGDMDKEKQEQEMATATVIEKVMDQNKELIDTVVRTSKERPMAPAAAVQAGPDVTAVLTMAGEVMKEASLNAIKNSNGMTMRDVIEMVDKMAPKHDAGIAQEVARLREQLDQERAERIAALERRLEAATVAAAAPPQSNNSAAAPSSPFAYFDEGLKAMEHMKSVTDKFSGGGGGGAAEEVGMPKFMSWLQPILTVVGSLGNNALQAWMMYQRQQQGLPVGGAMPNPVGGPVMQQQPASTPAGNPSPTPVSNIAGLPAPGTPATGPVDTDAAEMQEAIELFNSVQYPLLQHLQDPDAAGLTGVHFADWLIGGFGVRKYTILRKRGEMIEPALLSYEPIQTVIQALPEGRLHKFVDEFLTVDVDKILNGEYDQDEEYDEGDDEEGGGVFGGAPSVPVA